MAKVIIDANVIYLARIPVPGFSDDVLPLARKCIEFIENLKKDKSAKVVLDGGLEIYKEYLDAFTEVKETAPNAGAAFCHWFFTYFSRIAAEDFVQITPIEEKRKYKEFPNDPRLEEFDKSDKKYVAVANKHPEHPPIYEGSDSKWLGYRDVLTEYGINIIFLDENYAIQKFKEKMGID